MSATAKTEENVTAIGHNSKEFDEKAKKIIKEYSESLSRSAEENDIRKDLRDEWEELGEDSKALQDGIARSKKSLKLREGYDKSMDYFKAIHEEMGGAESLFSWVVEREDEKKKAREAARDAAREEREAQKAEENK